MSRLEEDREDLLREATALVARIEIRIYSFHEPILAGFRQNGAATFFFGQQMVFQFNSAKQLRRGFADGRLFKAEHGRLSVLTRQRTADAVALIRHDLSPEESSA